VLGEKNEQVGRERFERKRCFVKRLGQKDKRVSLGDSRINQEF
jgi:hypothetical protein